LINYAYIALILALLAFGKWYTDEIKTAGQNQCKAEYESQLRSELNDQVKIADNLQKKNSDLVVELINKQTKTKIIYREIEKKVNIYVKDNSACNLSRGAVQLRNTAADPEQLQKRYHPPISESDTREASSISQRTGERQIIEWGRLYSKVSTNYVALLRVCGVKMEKTPEN